jgi:hypothetical protein
MKKGMGKPMKKAQNGAVTKKKPAKTYPIISEEGDLADALNEYEAMKRKGTVPKTAAGANKQIDKWNKQGKLGPAKPKMKMGGAMKKAKAGFDLNKDGKTTFKDVLIGRGVLPKTAKKGASVKKCKYGCK